MDIQIYKLDNVAQEKKDQKETINYLRIHVLVLLSASVKRFSVSRMQDFLTLYMNSRPYKFELLLVADVALLKKSDTGPCQPDEVGIGFGLSGALAG